MRRGSADSPASPRSTGRLLWNEQISRFMAHEMENAFPALRAGAYSDVGSVRSENQDAYGCFPVGEAEARERLFIVADGMGGHQHGKEASVTAVQTVQHTFFAATEGTAADRLERSFEAANERVHELTRDGEADEKTGTTCTALAMSDGRFVLGHVGDSRAYRINDDGISQLTHDHTWTEAMRRREVLTKEEAANHPKRHVLVQALGIKPTVEVDLHELGPVKAGVIHLLCSDGLDKVAADDLQHIATSFPPVEACERLVQQALDHGSRDNVTALIVAAATK